MFCTREADCACGKCLRSIMQRMTDTMLTQLGHPFSPSPVVATTGGSRPSVSDLLSISSSLEGAYSYGRSRTSTTTSRLQYQLQEARSSILGRRRASGTLPHHHHSTSNTNTSNISWGTSFSTDTTTSFSSHIPSFARFETPLHWRSYGIGQDVDLDDTALKRFTYPSWASLLPRSPRPDRIATTTTAAGSSNSIAGDINTLGPVAVRPGCSVQRTQRLYFYDKLYAKRPGSQPTIVGKVSSLTNDPSTNIDNQANLHNSVVVSTNHQQRVGEVSIRNGDTGRSGGAAGLGLLSKLPMEMLMLVCYFLDGHDLGKMCCLNYEWYLVCTTTQQPLWQELVVKKYGFKYENYMLYAQLRNWHLMYAKATTFLRNLKNASPLVTAFKGLLLPPIHGYQGSLAVTADCSMLLWENGEYLQAIDVNEGLCLYAVPVAGERDSVNSHPCLVNTQTNIFLHLNKEIRVYCLATGTFLGYLEIPKEPGEKQPTWEPNDFSLDVSIRNQHVTFLARDALYVFDSDGLKFLYKVVHKETTPEDGVVCSDIDFLWAGYHCPGISGIASLNGVYSRRKAAGPACTCKESSPSVCRRKSRHIITWLRKTSRNIKIFDVCSGKEVAQLSGHRSKVLRVRQAQNIYRLEDYFLASLDVAGIVRIWDSTDNLFECIQTLDAASRGPMSNLSVESVPPSSRGSDSSSQTPFVPTLFNGGGLRNNEEEVEEDEYGRESIYGDTAVHTTFRLSFSSTHLMTMSEYRGQPIRVNSDYPIYTGRSRREQDDVPPDNTIFELTDKAVILKVWKFDPYSASSRVKLQNDSSEIDGEFFREIEEPAKVVSTDSLPNDTFCVASPAGQNLSWIDVADNDDVDSCDSCPRSRASSMSWMSVDSIPWANATTATSEAAIEQGGVLEEHCSYVLPDNSYFADFLDNQLVGVWMSHSTRHMDFVATLSDWRVFNCLSGPPKNSAVRCPSRTPPLSIAPDEVCARQEGRNTTNTSMEIEANADATTTRDAEFRESNDFVELDSLKNSFVFSMSGRGDIWTLLDWKCISVSPAGDLIVYDFCPIADATKRPLARSSI